MSLRDRADEVTPVIAALVIAFLVVGAILRATAAHGHPADDALSGWYRTLIAPDGTSCCSMRDCSPVDARIEHGTWEVRIGDAWVSVPPEAVLRRDNQDGRPIACIVGGSVKCFVPPSSV